MKYQDNIRQCCMELLSLNISVLNIEPVIRSVLKHIADFSVIKLPQKATLVRMSAEMKGIAYNQLAEQLEREEDLTIHSDGTSKFGEHFQVWRALPFISDIHTHYFLFTWISWDVN